MGKRVLEKVLDDMDRLEAPVSAGASDFKEDA
jgi:hypothetical protein